LHYKSYPTDFYANDLLKQPNIKKLFSNPANVTVSQLRNNILALNFYFPTLRYTGISQVPKSTFATLVADIGGTLGIFLVIFKHYNEQLF
jgi:hypothetical protein